jgi:hypothetical protein
VGEHLEVVFDVLHRTNGPIPIRRLKPARCDDVEGDVLAARFPHELVVAGIEIEQGPALKLRGAGVGLATVVRGEELSCRETS